MNRTRATAIAVTIALAFSTTGISSAADEYTFPSANGVLIATTAAPAFKSPSDGGRQFDIVAPLGGSLAGRANGHTAHRYEVAPPLPIIGYGSRGGDTYGYRFVTHALMSAAYANYAADHARLFAPGYAVTAWTDRVFGITDIGFSAVDGWTAAAYHMPRVSGPLRRRESMPDLSLMPTFRPHPELERTPKFER